MLSFGLLYGQIWSNIVHKLQQQRVIVCFIKVLDIHGLLSVSFYWSLPEILLWLKQTGDHVSYAHWFIFLVILQELYSLDKVNFMALKFGEPVSGHRFLFSSFFALLCVAYINSKRNFATLLELNALDLNTSKNLMRS